MAKYRSKEIVEAFKWEGRTSIHTYPQWFRQAIDDGIVYFRVQRNIWGLYVYVDRGDNCSYEHADEGCYIIKESSGLNICDPKDFEQEYEEVSDG